MSKNDSCPSLQISSNFIDVINVFIWFDVEGKLAEQREGHSGCLVQIGPPSKVQLALHHTTLLMTLCRSETIAIHTFSVAVQTVFANG
uniref:Uncharacterized protein n=1 Tax=Parascaris equorum TaxID=6256 RepID=A0A914S3Z5_PAREQ